MHKVILTQLTLLAELIPKYFEACTDLLKAIARACGYKTVQDFNIIDLSTNQLTAIAYAEVYKN